MKRTRTILAAIMAIASVATVRGVFGSDTIGYCVTNVASVVFDESMLSGGDAVFVYTSTASEFTFNVSSDVRAWILAVGGGGAGGGGLADSAGRGQGGGGGGGGFVETNGFRLVSGTYNVGVGAGGTHRLIVGGSNGRESYVRLANATNFLAKGGGGGAGANYGVGYNGASGGGGSCKSGTNNDGGTCEAGQGNVGGNGQYEGAGGGGGGAGGAGYDTPEAKKGGAGGTGRESAIMGSHVFYAGGGGGGGASDATYALGGKGGGGAGGSSTRAPVAGDDGFGGGGGGGGTGSVKTGGKGGSGVVIIRVSKVYGEVPYPEIRDYEYAGQPITVWDGDDECTVTGDALSQTAVGEYSFTVKPISPSTWKGGSSDETNYVWHIVKSSNYLRIIQDGGVEGSVAETRCEYKVTDDSNEPTVLYSNAENGTYADVVPTAPGVYWVRASIAETSNYDGAIAGPQPFRILGSDETPIAEKPLKYFSKIVVVEEITETGRVTVAVAKTHDWIADYNDGTDVRFCDAMGNLMPSRLESWNVDGSATFSVDVPPMRAGAVFYMCWGEVVGYSVPDVAEPSATAISVATTVGDSNSDPSRQLKNWIRDLSMSGWRAGVDSPSVPTCTAKIGIGTVQYKYAITGLTPSLVYDPANPPEPGIYDLQAVIDWTGDYDRASSEKVTFRVLREKESPLEALAYFAKITATGSQAEARSVTVTLPSTLDYRTMFNDGSDIRFCDANGSILNSRLDGAWATNGSAKFKVELPAFSSSFGFYMCWGPVTGVDVPATGTPTTTAATGVSLSAIVTAVRDTDKPALVNHWVTWPVFPDAWSTDDTPTYTPGDPAYPLLGYEFKFICRSMMTGDEVVTNELPTVGGDYQLIAFVDAGDFADGGSWAGITNEPWEVSISTRTPSISVTRYNGAEGRVLLMNDDVAPGCEIRNQGYYVTNSSASTFWEHTNSVPLSVLVALQRNLSNETEHTLWATGYDSPKRLWTLKNCRDGNMFPKNDSSAPASANNFLPWGSDNARDFHDNTSHSRHGAGQVVMRNTTDACIISSCFDDGIGTVYFDAVNAGKAEDKEFFKLKVWVATDCKTSLGDPVTDVAPTDEYVREFDEKPPASDVITTNANWRLVDVLPYKIEDGAIVGAAGPVSETNVNGVAVSVPTLVMNAITNTVTLDVTKGGSTNWYYRIVVPLDITGRARLKIERSSAYGGNADQINYYIPIDNLIASYPAMRASITTYGEGEYDSNKTGKDVIGVPNALTEAFPSPSSTNLFGRGKVSYITNAGVENPATNTFITSARFNYRWRYLNQLFYHDGETKTSDDGVFASGRLSAADGYVTTRPLDLPGLQGDIEYWYDLMLAAPYYEYHDYSGLDAGVGGYSENITNYVGRADSSYVSLPSAGTNWFVRVREGESAYEGMRLVVKDSSVTPAATEDVGMSLVGDHLWRGFVAVTNSMERKLTIEYIRAVNHQEEGATEYAINYEDFRSTVSNINISTRPFNGKMAMVGTGESFVASVEYLTNVASYIEFQFNDRTGAISISHADYQDFDTWFTSRRTTDDKFYSSRYVTNSTSIARHRYPASKDDKAVAGFAETPLTDNAWTENFRLTGTQTLSTNGFWIGKGFSSAKTPKGWDAEQGMWVAQRWGITNSTDFALQMEGCGKGSVTFDLTPTPNGLDTISFKTRLAQFSEWNDIAYSYENFAMTNYMFAAQACFDEDPKFANFSGEGSISLFAGYRPSKGAYEYRVTVYNVDAGGDACCRHAIYKWKVQGGKLVAEPLLDIRGDQVGWKYSDAKIEDRVKKMALGKDGNYYSGIYISFAYDRVLNAVTITAGVTMTDSTGSNKVALGGNFTYQDKNFFQIGVVDMDPVTKSGTYGVLSKNCPAQIYFPRVHANKAWPIPATGTTASGSGKRWIGKVTYLQDSGYHSEKNNVLYDDYWSLTPGRIESFARGSGDTTWGLMASTNTTQTVKVDVLPLGEGSSGWTNLAEVVVNTFNFSENKFTLQTTSPCQVRISAGGEAGDTRTDVAVDDIYLTQWCGTKGSAVGAYSGYAYRNDFYYTGSWISNRTERVGGKLVTERVALLAPRRADSPKTPVGIRSPYLEGFGAIMFSYVDCGQGAQLAVQRMEQSVGNLYSHIDDPADSDSWTTVTNFTFAAGERGTKTVFLGIRPPSNGVFRIVIPQAKVREAYAHPEYDANWGAVTITDIYCYDEPAFDDHSWWGWNFLTTGWKNGGGNAVAAIDDHADGAVGVLNNSLAVSSLETGDQDDYVMNVPFIQSPTIGKRSVGEVSFRARRYSQAAAGSPSYVTIWGAKDGNAQSTNEWVAITNVEVRAVTYARYTVKCAGDEGYAAIRVGVANVAGILPERDLEPADDPECPKPAASRVLVDEIVIRERVRPEVGFRLNFVRPFRSGLSDVAAILNIDSRDQQPLLNEQFGFQAEVEITGLAEEIDFTRTPEVYLSYYPSESPWGFANWKNSEGAVLDAKLTPAEGTNLIFRSASGVPLSFAGPYQAEDVLGYRIVQFSLWVKYWNKGGDPYTHRIELGEWEMPAWYRGFSPPDGFSPFTLLETVSPGRAWINEANFSDENWSADSQFVELCFPAGYDMTGWSIYRYNSYGKQELLATLGLMEGVAATKGATGGDPNFAFFVLTDRGHPVSEGEPCIWNTDLMYCDPFGTYGFRLVRPSGIIEQQIVVQGKLGSSPWDVNKSGELVAENLRDLVGGEWDFVGADTNAAVKSVGAFQNAGVLASDWNNTMDMTPGRLNCAGNIPDGWFLPPSGTNVWLTLSTVGGLAWVMDGVVRTNATVVVVPQGVGTNIYFETAPWHTLSLMRDRTNDVSSAASRAPGSATGAANRWTYMFKESNSSSATLMASGTPDDSVFERGGLDRDDIYTPAIMNWLLAGVESGAFEGDEISTNCFFQGLSLNGPRMPLPLKDRYWLDIDPTSDAWDLRGGMGEAANLSASVPTVPVVGEVRRRNRPEWPDPVTNRVVTVTLMISNKVDNALSHPPLRLQGLGGEKSDVVGARNWTSETFKVMMSLIKPSGADGIDVSDSYWPMAQFVFGPGSFGAPDGDHPYAARIEVHDPMSPGSPAYSLGWQLYPGSNYGYLWSLDHGRFLQDPDMLRCTNTWDRTWEANHDDY